MGRPRRNGGAAPCRMSVRQQLFCVAGLAAVMLGRCLATDWASIAASLDPGAQILAGWDSNGNPCGNPRFKGVTCDPTSGQPVALDLSNAGLSGSIPAEIAQIASLTLLDLSKNFFYGVLPGTLVNMNQLQIINFSKNNLNGPLVDFAQLTKLQDINLSYNNLQDTLSASTAQLAQLTSIQLNKNQLGGAIPESWGQLTGLKVLRLDSNQLTGPIPAGLTYLQTTPGTVYNFTGQGTGFQCFEGEVCEGTGSSDAPPPDSSLSPPAGDTPPESSSSPPSTDPSAQPPSSDGSASPSAPTGQGAEPAEPPPGGEAPPGSVPSGSPDSGAPSGSSGSSGDGGTTSSVSGTTPPPPGSSSSSSSISIPMIAGVAVGAALLIGAVVALIVCCYRRKKGHPEVIPSPPRKGAAAAAKGGKGGADGTTPLISPPGPAPMVGSWSAGSKSTSAAAAAAAGAYDLESGDGPVSGPLASPAPPPPPPGMGATAAAAAAAASSAAGAAAAAAAAAKGKNANDGVKGAAAGPANGMAKSKSEKVGAATAATAAVGGKEVARSSSSKRSSSPAKGRPSSQGAAAVAPAERSAAATSAAAATAAAAQRPSSPRSLARSASGAGKDASAMTASTPAAPAAAGAPAAGIAVGIVGGATAAAGLAVATKGGSKDTSSNNDLAPKLELSSSRSNKLEVSPMKVDLPPGPPPGSLSSPSGDRVPLVSGEKSNSESLSSPRRASGPVSSLPPAPDSNAISATVAGAVFGGVGYGASKGYETDSSVASLTRPSEDESEAFSEHGAGGRSSMENATAAAGGVGLAGAARAGSGGSGRTDSGRGSGWSKSAWGGGRVEALVETEDEGMDSEDGEDARGKGGGPERYFTVRELALATNDFGKQGQRNVLGTGRYGTVFRARLPDGTTVAVKKLTNRNLDQSAREFRFEAETMAGARHPNLVSLLGCCAEGDERMLVYEYVPNGTLEWWLHDPHRPGALDWPMRMHIAIGCARGLAHLHEGLDMKLVHRDVKSSNVLLDSMWHAKLGDFALAKIMGRDQAVAATRIVGTFGCAAPEYLNTGLLTERSDVFSFGVLLLEIATGRKPVDQSLPQGEMELVPWVVEMEAEGRLAEVLDPVLQDSVAVDDAEYVLGIALKCVETNALKRPRMSQVVSMLESEDPTAKDGWVPRRPSGTLGLRQSGGSIGIDSGTGLRAPPGLSRSGSGLPYPTSPRVSGGGPSPRASGYGSSGGGGPSPRASYGGSVGSYALAAADSLRNGSPRVMGVSGSAPDAVGLGGSRTASGGAGILRTSVGGSPSTTPRAPGDGALYGTGVGASVYSAPRPSSPRGQGSPRSMSPKAGGNAGSMIASQAMSINARQQRPSWSKR